MLRHTKGVVQPIRRVAAWLSLLPPGRWRDVIEGACSNPFFQGALGTDLRILPVHPPEGEVSPRTHTWSREPARLEGTDAGRVCSKRSILSRQQAAAAFLFAINQLEYRPGGSQGVI